MAYFQRFYSKTTRFVFIWTSSFELEYEKSKKMAIVSEKEIKKKPFVYKNSLSHFEN